MYLLFDFGI